MQEKTWPLDLEEHIEVFRAEEENLVEVMVRLSARPVDSQGTLCEIVVILHTHHVNTTDIFTIP